jgi:cysteine desulfurase family protein (TIGR01976 family)
VAYFDGPGGTQVPESVIEAMAGVLEAGVSNLGGPFASSRLAEETTAHARQAVADLFGTADPESIVFGQNMTSLTFSMSRALARTWRPGDRIVVTSLDHDANVTPWRMAAADAGVAVDVARFDSESYRLSVDAFEEVLTDRTRLVAVTHASNAIGTIPDVAAIAEVSHRVGALVYVDAVHYAPHGIVSVDEIGADFLAASAYKFFGPHTGCLYGRRESCWRSSMPTRCDRRRRRARRSGRPEPRASSPWPGSPLPSTTWPVWARVGTGGPGSSMATTEWRAI